MSPSNLELLFLPTLLFLVLIEIKNNKARHNLSNVKYCQMAFRLVDGTVIGFFWELLGQTKVMRSHQREITWSLFWFVSNRICSWLSNVKTFCSLSLFQFNNLGACKAFLCFTLVDKCSGIVKEDWGESKALDRQEGPCLGY